MKWVPNNSYSVSHKVLTDHIGKNYQIIDGSLNPKVAQYFTTTLNAFTLSLLYSLGLAIIYYIWGSVEKVDDVGMYLRNNLPSQNQITLFYVIKTIQVFKDAVFGYIISINQDVARIVFTFITFSQSFFLFYYTSIITGAIKNKSYQSKDGAISIVMPLFISIGALYVVYINKESVDLVNKQATSKIITREAYVENQLKQNKNLQITAQQLQQDLNNTKVIAEQYHKELDKYKNAKLNRYKLLKCTLPFTECKLSDIID
jgi:hypothetical protein